MVFMCGLEDGMATHSLWPAEAPAKGRCRARAVLLVRSHPVHFDLGALDPTFWRVFSLLLLFVHLLIDDLFYALSPAAPPPSSLIYCNSAVTQATR